MNSWNVRSRHLDSPRVRETMRTVLHVVVITGAGKVLGFVREVLISSLFGVSRITDAFFAVQQLLLVAQNYIFGAFNLAFIPHFVESVNSGRAKAFLGRMTLGVISVAGLYSVAIYLGSSSWVPVVTGVTAHAGELTGAFARLLAVAVVPIAIAGLAFGILHARRHHAKAVVLQGSAPFFMLLSLVIGAVFFERHLVWALPVSFLTGTLASAFWATSILWKELGAPMSSAISDVSDLRERFFRQLGGASLENLGFNTNQLLNVFFAGLTGAGSIAVLAFSGRIAMLALSGFVSPLNQVIHSSLSNTPRAARRAKFLRVGVPLLAAIIVIAVLLILVSDPLVRVIYERGAFSPDDTARVASLLVPYAVYFLIMAWNQTMSRYYFATFSGDVYTRALLAGYLVANLAKLPFSRVGGVNGVIWACVVGEGLAALYLTFRVVARGEAQ